MAGLEMKPGLFGREPLGYFGIGPPGLMCRWLIANGSGM